MPDSFFSQSTKVRPPLTGWTGGKSKLAMRIIEQIPKHTCYIEPFAGAAWVLFRKPESKTEVLNDINKDVVNLYRCIQYHLEEFVRFFKWALVSRDEFERLKKARPETLTDIQRAARFYYLQQSAYSGKIISPSFGYATMRPATLNLLRIEEYLSEAHLRLARAYIENLPYGDVISRYDREGSFFYIDPPYWNNENDYGKGIFAKEDFTLLAEQLALIKGKFLLSINDCDATREIFKAFTIEPVQTRYCLGSADRKKPRNELFIKNY